MILDALVAPNPATGDPTSFYCRLSSEADDVRLLIYSPANRRVRDARFGALSGGIFHALDLHLVDSLGRPLANGAYHFVVEAYQGAERTDSKAGSFFILR